jgi:hypothetical protein
MLARVMSVSMGVVSLEESGFGVSASLAVSSPWRDILIAYAIWSASDIMLENRGSRKCYLVYVEEYN